MEAVHVAVIVPVVNFGPLCAEQDKNLVRFGDVRGEDGWFEVHVVATKSGKVGEFAVREVLYLRNFDVYTCIMESFLPWSRCSFVHFRVSNFNPMKAGVGGIATIYTERSLEPKLNSFRPARL